MQIANTSHRSIVPDETSTIDGKVSDRAIRSNQASTERSQEASDSTYEKVAFAASGLDRAATTLHGSADRSPSVEKVGGLAHKEADRLCATQGVLREYEVDRVMGNVKAIFHRNPSPLLLVAGAVGVLGERAFLGSKRICGCHRWGYCDGVK
jgi:hypothetical protein